MPSTDMSLNYLKGAYVSQDGRKVASIRFSRRPSELRATLSGSFATLSPMSVKSFLVAAGVQEALEKSSALMIH